MCMAVAVLTACGMKGLTSPNNSHVMNIKNSRERYGALAIGLHWLIVLQLIGVYACINLVDLFPEHSDPQRLLKTWHFLLGLTVLAVALVRLLNRLSAPSPVLLSSTPRWQRWLASAVHVALYAFLLVMPLLGWLTLSAEGHPISIFGAALPGLIAPNEAWAHSLKEIHETIGVAGYYLIGLHAGAALFHHFVVRDGTLARMVPFLATRQRSLT